MNTQLFFQQGKLRSQFLKYLIGYYPFSDLNDYATNPANLGGVFTDFTDGKLGNSVEFLNTGAAILRTHSGAKYSFSNGTSDVAFSLSFWIYYKGGGSGDRYIFGRNAFGSSVSNGNAEYRFLISPTTSKLAMLKHSLGSASNAIALDSISVLPINQWTHLVYTDDGLGNEKMYINGVSETPTKRNIGSGYVRMTTGNQAREAFGNAGGTALTTTRFLGMLDDFGIFKEYVLTEKDVDFIYNNGVGRTLI